MRPRRGSSVASRQFKVQRSIVATAKIMIFSDTHSTFLAFLRVFFKEYRRQNKTVRMRTVCEWTKKQMTTEVAKGVIW
jgi:sulfur relay (sulfurtransferase) DsrC/TusE family protein